MRRSRKYCQRWSKFDKVFLGFFFLGGGEGRVDEGIDDPNITVNRPSSAPPAKRHMLFR